MIENEDFVKDKKLIPLNDFSKIASVKWNTDEIFDVKNTIKSYAIDTGRSNLVVIDCDVKNHIDGISNFLDICEKNNYSPKTLTVSTPSGGLHFYYSIESSDNYKSTNGTVLGKAIDIRAQGGYVVGPGSQVKDSNGDILEYEIENDCHIEKLPHCLKMMILEHEKKTNNASSHAKNHKDNRNNNPTEEIAKKEALNWALDKMSMAQEGERQSILNSISYFMGRKRVDKEQASKLIDVAIGQGLSYNEASQTFLRAYEQGSSQEVQEFDIMVKEFNKENNISFKDDPMDTGYYSHIGLSYNFYQEYKNKFLYWGQNLKWYEYDDKLGFWNQVEEQNVRTYMKIFLETLVEKIRKDNTKIPQHIYKMQEKLWVKSTIEAVTVVARSDFTINSNDLFDSNPYFVNCLNGVLDLRTKELYPHDQNYYLTCKPEVRYIDNAKNDICDKIIESIHPDEREYMKIIAGQSLIGKQPRSQAAFFLHGRGSNGKSTFIDLMLKTSGSYGKLLPPNVFAPEKTSDNYALADFEGLRLAVIEELPDSKQLNSGALKRIVGTQRINSRQIYSKNREFNNNSTIFVSCNRLPMINETDDGTWRRLVVITFPYSYKKTVDEINNEWDRLSDPKILYYAQNSKKVSEAFFKWRVEGAYQWIQDDKIEYNRPQSIVQKIEEWNENNDLMLSWFKEKINLSTNYFITTSDLLTCYNDWLKSRGNNTVSMRYFNEIFKNHKIFYTNNLVQKNQSRILKEYTQSVYNHDSKIYSASDRTNYILGIAFK